MKGYKAFKKGLICREKQYYEKAQDRHKDYICTTCASKR